MHTQKRSAFVILAALLTLAVNTAILAADAITPTSSIALFNGKDLSGWIAYGKDNSPDASKTWSVQNGVLHDTGSPNGYLRTTKRYTNYRLHVEWRWLAAPLDEKGKPRTRNSGVLLHMQGEDAVWPKCIEAQLMEKNAGDFYAINGVDTKELRQTREAALAAAGNDEAAKKKAAGNRRLAKKVDSNEKPDGEWNAYDIVCRGDTITLTVNGLEQNRTTGVNVQEGHICLQSEGAPIEFRAITLTPLQ